MRSGLTVILSDPPEHMEDFLSLRAGRLLIGCILPACDPRVDLGRSEPLTGFSMRPCPALFVGSLPNASRSCTEIRCTSSRSASAIALVRPILTFSCQHSCVATRYHSGDCRHILLASCY